MATTNPLEHTQPVEQSNDACLKRIGHYHMIGPQNVDTPFDAQQSIGSNLDVDHENDCWCGLAQRQ